MNDQALDLILWGAAAYVAWHVLKVLGPLSQQVPGRPGGLNYSGGGVNVGNAANAGWPDLLAPDWAAPRQTNFHRPPAGYVWNDPLGAYTLKDPDGAVVGIYT